MTSQLEASAARKLNDLEKKIARAAANIAKETETYEELWKEAYEVFDEELGEGEPAAFICEDGYVIGRTIAHYAPTVDASKLIVAVRRSLTPLKASRLLNRVLRYEPVVDQTALAKEVTLERIEAKVVEKCVTPRANVARKRRHEASAKDRQKLEAGILLSPTWDDELSA